MSGHSKWSTIRHKKGAADARRGKVFSKIIKEITVAARMGGGDPGANPRLRNAIASAKAENMPKDNMERAIKKGTGELEGTHYEEMIYEGYGPGGAAVLVEALTDNKRRAAAEVRHVFSKCAGSLGEAGCVSWMFQQKGLLVVEKGTVGEEALMEAALEAGAEDVREEETTYEVVTAAADLETVKEALEAASIAWSEAEVTMIPQNTVRVEGKEAEQLIRLLETLEEAEDVQKVHSNADISYEGIEDAA